MPERFLLQVLRVLVKHQVLKSTCGVAGGYCLARAPERISLRDLLLPFDDLPQRAKQMLQGVSEEALAKIVGSLNSAAEIGWDELQKVTLAEMTSRVRKPAEGRPSEGGIAGNSMSFLSPVATAFEKMSVTH